MKTDNSARCGPCYGSGWRHSMFDFCNCKPECKAHDGQGNCACCRGRGTHPRYCPHEYPIPAAGIPPKKAAQP